MTTLGLHSEMKQGGEVRLAMRKGWLKSFTMALGGAGGFAVVLAVLDLFQHEPSQGFSLLQAWGPWPFIAILGISVLGKLMGDLNGTIRGSFDTIANSSIQQGSAAIRTADALTKLADQGGKQAEEVRRLAIYAAQEFPSVYERLDRQDLVLGEISGAVKQLVARGDEGGRGERRA